VAVAGILVGLNKLAWQLPSELVIPQAILCGVLTAVILGAVALTTARRRDDRSGRGPAIGGVVTGAIAIVASIAGTSSALACAKSVIPQTLYCMAT
jgi:FtsH-binding integral membrane protein